MFAKHTSNAKQTLPPNQPFETKSMKELFNYLRLTYPHQMPTISQDNHDSRVQFFHQARRSWQICRDVSIGNSRVGRDLLSLLLLSPPSPSAASCVHIHETPSARGRPSAPTASSPSAAATPSTGSRLRGWDLIFLGRSGRRWWQLLLFLLRCCVHGFVLCCRKG